MTNENEENNWENRWRKTLGQHQSTPSTEDWSGMKHLLETQKAEPAEAFADPNMPRFPEPSTHWFFKFWPQSLLGLLLIVGLGFCLGQCQAEEIANEIKSEIDFFSKEADSSVDYHRSSADLGPGDEDNSTQSRCPPGPAYRVTTYQVFDENGDATGELVHDTIWWNVQEYRFDTIYDLDDLGNLTTRIARIDSTKVAGLH